MWARGRDLLVRNRPHHFDRILRHELTDSHRWYRMAEAAIALSYPEPYNQGKFLYVTLIDPTVSPKHVAAT